MKIHPYMFFGIGCKPWITYRINEGYAEIVNTLRRTPPSSILLKDASIKPEEGGFAAWIGACFGLGAITITSINGDKQTWAKVRNFHHIADTLLRVAKGQPIFGDEALNTHAIKKHAPAEIHTNYEEGYSYIIDPRDGNSYKVVKLRDGKWWLAENLTYEIDGSTPAYPLIDPSKRSEWPECEKAGRLYTWNVAKIAPPPGWHLPSDQEWRNMLNAYGGYVEYSFPERSTIKDNNDLATLIYDELKVQFGDVELNLSDRLPSKYYIYYDNYRAGKFWSSSRPSGIFGIELNNEPSAMFYLLRHDGVALRSQEYDQKDFSIRCVKD